MATVRVSGESKSKRVGMLPFLAFLYLMALIPFSLSVFEPKKLEVQNILKQLNKPAVKSIKSPDGDVIDCVHVSHQPALDHPLLKNHTIQMKPSFLPEWLSKSKQSSNSITQMWQSSGGRCPEGTIPIRRTTEDDILRASSLRRFGKKEPGTVPHPHFENPEMTTIRTTHEVAVAYVGGDEYYGTSASINLWKPKIQQPNEYSLSQLWIMGGSGENTNTIESGWQVFPNKYGDSNPRLFVYWTNDNYQTSGCYNLQCSGFVQISNQMVLGGSITPVSTYGGSQYEIGIAVWKDPKQGKWWMAYQNNVVGYWPSSLFPSLAEGASIIEWGGEVLNLKSNSKHTSTQMGSGHFPEEGFGKASYFRNVVAADKSLHLKDLSGASIMTTQSNCYDVKLGSSADMGNYLYYGGTGRNLYCP